DVFNYTMSDGTDTDIATLTISITGANDAPVAVDDFNEITELFGDSDAIDNNVSGNVISGAGLPNSSPDSDVDGDDLDVTAITSVSGNLAVDNGTSFTIVGKYGKLTIDKETGAYTYELDDSNPDVNALDPGEMLEDEIFTYTISDGTATDTADLKITVKGNDEPSVLNGVMKTNSNVTNQFVALTFVQADNPLHAASKIYDLDAQGQQGSVVQDVGFNIDDSKQYLVSLEAVSGTKAIVTDFSLEGVVFQTTGTTQLEKTETTGKHVAVTGSMTIDNAPTPDQGFTNSTDGTAAGEILNDPTPASYNYLYGASGGDTLNGSSDADILNGGNGQDTINGNGGNDIIVFDNANNDIIDGGDGFDLLRVDDGALALSLLGSNDDANTINGNILVHLEGKNISNIEGILITEEAGTSTPEVDPNDDIGTTITLSAQDVLDYTDDGNTLYILGSPGDEVDLDLVGEGWTQVGTDNSDPDGQSFAIWQASVGTEVATLMVESDVSVT
ncbi:MAG: hypothetical protein EP324_02065, partial [Gammaproteobacteria bacterium]